MNILGGNLRGLRQARGLKQEEVANALGVSRATYSSWERGRTEPNIAWLRTLARYFGVSLDLDSVSSISFPEKTFLTAYVTLLRLCD